VEVNAELLGVELHDGRALRLPLSLFPTLAEAPYQTSFVRHIVDCEE